MTNITVEEALSLSVSSGNTIIPPNVDTFPMSPKSYSDYKKLLTCNLGRWSGGKSQRFNFPFETKTLLNSLQAGERPNYKQDWHYFPTPKEVIEKMFNIHLPLYDGVFLEPSAGKGAIVRGILELGGSRHNQEWDVIEMEPTNREFLKNSGYNLVGSEFLGYETEKRYDAIFANPPFKHDIAHVEKMISLLKKYGVIVCVLPSSFPEKYQEKIAQWEYENLDFYHLKDNSFKESGTRVSATIMSFCKS